MGTVSLSSTVPFGESGTCDGGSGCRDRGYVAGTWELDPVHSQIGFVVRHLMVSKIRGHFFLRRGKPSGDDVLLHRNPPPRGRLHPRRRPHHPRGDPPGVAERGGQRVRPGPRWRHGQRKGPDRDRSRAEEGLAPGGRSHYRRPAWQAPTGFTPALASVAGESALPGCQPTARMTSEALMTAVTWLPSARPSWRTASTVIEATRRTPLASSSTLAIASPTLMPVTRAGIWFRALSCMISVSRDMIDDAYRGHVIVAPSRAAGRGPRDAGHGRARWPPEGRLASSPAVGAGTRAAPAAAATTKETTQLRPARHEVSLPRRDRAKGPGPGAERSRPGRRTGTLRSWTPLGSEHEHGAHVVAARVDRARRGQRGPHAWFRHRSAHRARGRAGPDLAHPEAGHLSVDRTAPGPGAADSRAGGVRPRPPANPVLRHTAGARRGRALAGHPGAAHP